ncbi:MAG: hypothetical protein ACOCX2_06785, partial [Armatimonadota bacterium]
MIRNGAVWCAAGRQLVRLDAEDGDITERRRAEARTSDAIAAHGRIYWATTDGHIGAVELER